MSSNHCLVSILFVEPSSLEFRALEPSSLEPSSLEPSSLEPSSLEPSSLTFHKRIRGLEARRVNIEGTGLEGSRA